MVALRAKVILPCLIQYKKKGFNVVQMQPNSFSNQNQTGCFRVHILKLNLPQSQVKPQMKNALFQPISYWIFLVCFLRCFFINVVSCNLQCSSPAQNNYPLQSNPVHYIHVRVCTVQICRVAQGEKLKSLPISFHYIHTRRDCIQNLKLRVLTHSKLSIEHIQVLLESLEQYHVQTMETINC